MASLFQRITDAADGVLHATGIDALTGSARALAARGRRPEPAPLREALARLADHAGPGPAERPVFLLASAWRSGSTLLQRLLMSDPGCCIWGEPYDRAAYVQRLAATLRTLDGDWPPPHYRADPAGVDPRTGWIANLYPDLDALVAAHRAFLRELLATPAVASGRPRWGMKEVRLGADHASYLRLLFPRAALVLLHRNPYAAYASFATHAGWYARWPTGRVATPAAFGRHWRELTAGFLRARDELGALLVSFDELTTDQGTVTRVAEHCGLELDAGVLEHRVQGSANSPGGQQLTKAQIAMLAREVEPLAGRLGYRP